MSRVTELKKLLIDSLITGLETLKPDDKGFSGVATAALAAVKTFHDEVAPETAQHSAHLSASLARFQKRGEITPTN